MSHSHRFTVLAVKNAAAFDRFIAELERLRDDVAFKQQSAACWRLVKNTLDEYEKLLRYRHARREVLGASE